MNQPMYRLNGEYITEAEWYLNKFCEEWEASNIQKAIQLLPKALPAINKVLRLHKEQSAYKGPVPKVINEILAYYGYGLDKDRYRHLDGSFIELETFKDSKTPMGIVRSHLYNKTGKHISILKSLKE